MNVLEILDKELQGKQWSLEEKVRYVYIRSCELFTYDERYDLCDMEEYKGIKIEEIKDRIIDLENLVDNRIICTTYAKQVLPQLMSELLNVHCVANGTAHIYNTMDVNGRFLLADPTISSDLARVKMGLYTYGYKPMEKDHNFDANLEYIDKSIKYINEGYENSFLKQRIDNIYYEFTNETGLKKSDDFLIYKLYVIKELFEKYDLKNFSDAEYCIAYLINKFLNKDDKIKYSELFEEISEKSINRINIYPFQLRKEELYFILHSIDSEFFFYEISKNDAKKYMKTLDGINKRAI